jgi:hypothetical protein
MLRVLATAGAGALLFPVAAGCASSAPVAGPGRRPTMPRESNLRTMFQRSTPSGTRTVYVNGDEGSDSNDGSREASAYATIQHAVDVAQPGDRILVAEGIYGYLSIYGYRGDPEHWLSIESINDRTRPVINVANNSGDDGVDIQQSSFVGLYGFEIEGLQTSNSPNPSGVAVFRGCDHIAVWNNDIHDFPGGGVNNFYIHSNVYNGETLPAGGWDLVDVFFNEIHETSKYNPTNTSGISFYGAVDTTGSRLPGGYGYRAVGNYIYDVICTVDSSSGAGNYPFVTDGNGISVDSLSRPYDSSLQPYTKTGLVEANVLVGNGGRGVHVYNSVNMDGLFNTAVGNLRTDSPAINNGVELDSNIPNGSVNYYGNVILPLNTRNSTDGVSSYRDNVVAGGTQDVPAKNIDRTTVGSGYLRGRPTPESVAAAHPMDYFRPRHPDFVPTHYGMTGFQALDSGPRRTASTIPVGALN